MKKKQANKYNLSDRDLLIYNYMSCVLGVFSIALSPTGFFGVILGLLGLCLSLTYYEIKQRLRIGYILCIIGSLVSAIFLAIIIHLAFLSR
jgi:hypothetical protein